MGRGGQKEGRDQEDRRVKGGQKDSVTKKARLYKGRAAGGRTAQPLGWRGQGKWQDMTATPYNRWELRDAKTWCPGPL